MKRLLPLLAILLFIALCAVVIAQPLECSAKSGWWTYPAWPGWLVEYKDGLPVAAYHPATDEYWAGASVLRKQTAPPWGAKSGPNFGIEDRWKAARDAAKRAEDAAAAALAKADELADKLRNEPATNFGIVTDQMGKSGCAGCDHFWLNGRAISRDEAMRRIGGTLVDDSKLVRLTVIGPDAERKQVMDDLAKAPLAAWKDKLLVQSYAPDNWAVAKYGFVTTGKPTIYLQRADGATLHRQDDYTGGSENLAKVLQRKADPNYDPKKDPDLRKPAPMLPGLPGIPADLYGVPTYAVAAAVAAAVVLLAFLGFRKLPTSTPVAPASPMPVIPAAAPVKVRPIRRRPVSEEKMSDLAEEMGIEHRPMMAAAPRPEPTLVGLIRAHREKRQRERDEIKARLAAHEQEDKDLRDLPAGGESPKPETPKA